MRPGRPVLRCWSRPACGSRRLPTLARSRPQGAAENGGAKQQRMPTAALGRVAHRRPQKTATLAFCFLVDVAKARLHRARSGIQWAMATVQSASQLRRLVQLTEITRAFRARFPDGPQQRIGLAEVARLCTSLVSSGACRDCHDVRDDILTIACLWDLASDALEEQSDELLAALTDFIAEQGHGQRLRQ